MYCISVIVASDDHTPAWRPPPGEESLPKHLRTESKVTFDSPLTQPTFLTRHELMPLPPHEDRAGSDASPEDKNSTEKEGEDTKS